MVKARSENIAKRKRHKSCILHIRQDNKITTGASDEDIFVSTVRTTSESKRAMLQRKRVLTFLLRVLIGHCLNQTHTLGSIPDTDADTYADIMPKCTNRKRITSWIANTSRHDYNCKNRQQRSLKVTAIKLTHGTRFLA